MNTVIVTTDEAIKAIIKSALVEHDLERRKDMPVKLFTVNQVAKRLGMAHSTISKLVKGRKIKATKSGRISETAINEYLKNK